MESYRLECCPECGGKLVASRSQPHVLQQVELAEKPTVVTEHRGLAFWCPRCRKVRHAPIPQPVVKSGLFGPRLTALVGYLQRVCHASFSTIGKFLRDVGGVEVSRGYLAKVVRKVSESLAGGIGSCWSICRGRRC